MGGAAAAVSVPVLSAEVPAGHGTAVDLRRATDPPRAVDGQTGDWRGRPSGFGGSTIYSSGELVYQDHIFDAYGPDNGQDVQRLKAQDALEPTVPEIYRLDPAAQYLPGEFGIPTPGYNLSTHYGDLEHQDEADLSELHVGADAGSLWILARTTTMTAPAKTALLVLLDTKAGDVQREVPFGSGLHSTTADYALLLTASGGWVADMATNKITPLPSGSTAANPSGYVNALEARIPRSAIPGLPSDFKIAAATGVADGDHLKDLGLGANLANVAFREDEPSRDWWDKRQAFSLYDRTIDPFFHAVSLAKLRGGANQRYEPGPYYHDRIFHSAEAISQEKGDQGVLQHYGVYLPTSYRADRPAPVQWWFHFRGGNAHIAAAAVPRIFKDEGEDLGTIVVSPDGRGTSRWYVGKGQVDYQEVWADVHRSFAVDRNREYISGHSMGGWATYLLTILQPDRFAAGLPASGPVTQGAYTGVDVPNCDKYESPDGETPCYTSANGGDPRAEYTEPLLDNLRWVPLAIYQGAADELVPVSGVLVQANRLRELGYRYRLYLFPAQEHYGPPIQDQWADGARYEHRFVRDPNPPSVTFMRSMPMERSVEHVQSDGVPLDFSFDSAYWVSGLTPADDQKGVARIDARSLALPDRPHSNLPEAGGPATPDQTGPYAMVGQAWTPGAATPSLGNAFTAKLTGATAVMLDTGRMRLDPRRPISGTITTEKPLRLELHGTWRRLPRATLDGSPVPVTRVARDAIVVAVPAGTHRLRLSTG